METQQKRRKYFWLPLLRILKCNYSRHTNWTLVTDFQKACDLHSNHAPKYFGVSILQLWWKINVKTGRPVVLLPQPEKVSRTATRNWWFLRFLRWTEELSHRTIIFTGLYHEPFPLHTKEKWFLTCDSHHLIPWWALYLPLAPLHQHHMELEHRLSHALPGQASQSELAEK